MKKILITGSKGQLGNEMRVLSTQYPAYSFLFTDLEELDITDSDALVNFFTKEKPDFVVNCAAYTAVDKAEDDVELCYKINRNAVRNLGAATKSIHAKIIHVSTDYVFDGTSYIPYTEDMPVCPATVYGKSKLAGEQTLMDVCPESVIIRTSWLYSSFGNNFVKTMIKLGNERAHLNVIFDQVGTPTYAADLATVIMKVIDSGNFVRGIYHFSDEGVCSWYDFTKEIHAIADINCDVKPIESKDYPTPTPRPHYSVLNKAKIKSTYGIEIPYWKDSLRKCIDLLIGE
jgi:dTDP-4-dehydrorhamnose reductase